MTAKPPTNASPTADETNEALQRVLRSAIFAGANRQQAMLRFVVAESLAGRSESLKESVVAMEVFERDSSFDSRSDSIVRVEARKLRDSLTRYYADEGSSDPFVISIPKGGYQPLFKGRDPEAAAPGQAEEAAVDADTSVERPAIGDSPRWTKLRVAVVTAALIGVVVAAIVWRGRASALSREANPADPGTIAVLPFIDRDASKENQYFADGLTDQVIDVLSRLEGVRVVAKTSAFQFRDKAGDVRQIGKSLSAAFVMEGSVERSGSEVRATARLIQTSDGFELWSRSYSRKSDNLFELQGAIANDILRTVRARRGGTDEVALAAHYPTNGQAYEHFLRGLFAYDRDSQEGLELSLKEYEEALRLDPRYAPAVSAEAGAFVALGIYGMWKPDAAIPAARDAAQKALQLDPGMADAYAVLGYVAAVYDWNWTQAGDNFRKAVELNPNCAHCRAWYAIYALAPTGQAREALDQLARCLELDPLSVRFQAFRIMVPVMVRDNARAVDEAQRFLEQNADDYIAHLYLSSALRQMGRTEQAVSEAQRAARLTGSGALSLRFLAEAYGAAGNREQVRAIDADLQNRARTAYVSPVVLASVKAALGEKETAAALFNRAVDEHDPSLVFLRPSALFQTMKGTGAFDAAWHRIGLPN